MAPMTNSVCKDMCQYMRHIVEGFGYLVCGLMGNMITGLGCVAVGMAGAASTKTLVSLM